MPLRSSVHAGWRGFAGPTIYEEILAFLDRRTEAELYETVWYTTLTSQQAYTFGRLIQLNTASPLRSAYHRLQHWRQVDD